MTRAVCIFCGATKIGALSPCAKCGRDAVTPDEQAQALIASDRGYTPADREALAASLADPAVQRILNPTRWQRFKLTVGIMAILAFVLGTLAVVFGIVIELIF